MNCPVCGGKMKEIEKSGVLLDLCPECKGVWLDRGELEKLMDYAATTGAATAAGPGSGTLASPAPPPLPGADRDGCEMHGHGDDDGDDEHSHGQYGHQQREGHRRDGPSCGSEGPHGPYPRRKSWASSIFDMFGD